MRIVRIGGAGLGNPVVGFAERAAGAAAGKPGVETAGVEGVAAGEAADLVVEFEVVETNGAGVAGFGVGKFGGNGGMDGIVGVVCRVILDCCATGVGAGVEGNVLECGVFV